MVKRKLSIVPLDRSEKIFLQEVYDRNFRGERFTFKEIWGSLHKKLPKNFRPEHIDSRLTARNGEEISLEGVLALTKQRSVIKQVDDVINGIWELILMDTKKADIEFADVVEKTGQSMDEASFYFKLAAQHATLWRGSAQIGDTLKIKSINIDGDMEIFHAYKEFSGIEVLILAKEIATQTRQLSYFTQVEIVTLDAKFSELKLWIANKLDEQSESLTDHQRITMIVLAEEIEELKPLLTSVPKKNFIETAIGKFGSKGLDKFLLEPIFEQLKKILEPTVKGIIENTLKGHIPFQ